MNKADIAVRADNLSKVYRIGLREKSHDSLASVIIDLVRSPITNYRKYRSLYRFDDVMERFNFESL